MDFADQASDREMADREFALATQRAALLAGPSWSHCLDCGEPIPTARQQAVPGVTLCVECQSTQEHQGRTHA